MIKEKIKSFVNEHKEEITRDLMALIKIPSVSTNKQECERMLLFTKSLYEKNGFSTQMGDEYLLSYYGQGEKEIGLFAHGDVVEAKDDWTLTKNGFEPVIYNGMLVGRGSWDDKSAIVCSLYTLKALRELNFPISKRIACYTGANEENGMSDIINYRKTNTPPDFSLVLDAGFPLYYGDKGKAWVRARAKKPFSQFVNLCGGKMINITLGDCKAQLAYTSELYESIRETDILKKEIKGDEIVIKAQGISAHGASPEGTVNGAYIIAESLKDNPYICKNDREILNSLSLVLSSPYGAGVGIGNYDKDFGRLTMTNGIVNVEKSHLAFTLDLRFGKTAKMEEMLQKLTDFLDIQGFDVEILSKDDAYCISTDNEYAVACLNAYCEYTGKKDAPMHINAGSTYARHIGNACETGTCYERGWLNLPPGHGNAHQPDEYIDIDGLLRAIEIIIYMVATIGNDNMSLPKE